MALTLSEVARLLNLNLPSGSNPHLKITGINTLAEAKASEIAFLSNPKYAPMLATTKAAAVLLTKEMVERCPSLPLVMDNPYLGFALLAQAFDRTPKLPPVIAKTAVVPASAKLGPGCALDHYVVLGENVTLGKNVSLGANVVIGPGVHIGDDTRVYPNVTIYHEVMIGQRCIIHSGAVIGSDGFGYASYQGQWHKIPQLGQVIIGDDVEIGANTTIDRGALSNTKVANGVKIDNQVQLGHNVTIGEHTAMAAMTGVAGSTKIGSYCLIGGASAIGGHIEITDRVALAGGSMVSHSIEAAGEYGSAITVQEKSKWQRNLVRFMHLDAFAKRLKALEKMAADYLNPQSKGSD